MSEILYADSPTEVRISHRYKFTLDDWSWNESLVKVLKSGLYDKDDTLLEIVSDTSVKVNKFTAMVLNEAVSVVDSASQLTVVKDILTKIDTRISKTLTGVDYTAPYVVLEFLFVQSTTVVPKLKTVAYSAIDPTKQLVLGKALYRDNVGTKDELYGFDETYSIQKSPLLEAEGWLAEFTASPTGDKQITIKGGLVDGVVVPDAVYDYGSTTGQIDIPTTGNHRYDLFYVNSSNAIVYVKGQEEANAGNDEDPKPDKPNIFAYDFPVSYIYVTGNLNGSRVFETADMENVTPRFTRTSTAVTVSVTDVIIKSQTDCDAYFGLNNLLDQGGTTPGLFNDGFSVNSTASITRSGIKTIEVDGKTVTFKNLFDSNGDPVPYDIYNRIIFSSNSRLSIAENVTFNMYNSYSGFLTKNETTMVIDRIRTTKFEVLAQDAKYTDITQNNYLTPVALEPSQDVVAFNSKKNGDNNQKYKTVSIEKSVSDNFGKMQDSDLMYASGPVDTTNFDSVQYTDSGVLKSYVVYSRSTDVYIQGYKIDSEGKRYERFLAETKVNSAGNYTTVRVAVNDSRVVIIAYDSTNNELKLFHDAISDTPWSSTQVADQVENSSNMTKHEVFLDDTTHKCHIAGVLSTNVVRYLQAVYSGPAYNNFTNSDIAGSDASSAVSLGFVLDGTDRYITYQEADTYLTYGKSVDGSAWSTGEYDNSAACGQESRLLVVDDPDNPGTNLVLVLYTHGANKDKVKIGTNDIGGGGADLIDIETVLDEPVSASGYEHLAFKLNTGNVYQAKSLIQVFAYSERGGEVIDADMTTGGGGSGPRIVADSNDILHVAYVDRDNQYLKYATNASGSWVTTNVDTNGDVNFPTEDQGLGIDVDADGKVYIAYYRGEAGTDRWSYATNRTGSWVLQTWASGTRRGQFNSIVVDKLDGTVNAVCYFGGAEDNFVTGNDGGVPGDWNYAAIDTTGDVGQYTSLAVDPVDQTYHACYRDVTNSSLKYVTFNQVLNQFDFFTIDNTWDMGKHTSMKLDSKGFVHISYYSEGAPNTGVRYATNKTGEWVFQMLDTSGGEGTSLVIDINDNVYIAYKHGSDLRVISNATGRWVYVDVETTNSVDAGSVSLAVDSKNKLYVVYQDNTNDDVRIAYVDSSLSFAQSLLVTAGSRSWSVATVDSHAGYSSIMALDNDYLLICFQDADRSVTAIRMLNYMMEVEVGKTLKDVDYSLLSSDFVENANITANIDGNKDNVHLDTCVSIANSINSEFNINAKNVKGGAVISGNFINNSLKLLDTVSAEDPVVIEDTYKARKFSFTTAETAFESATTPEVLSGGKGPVYVGNNRVYYVYSGSTGDVDARVGTVTGTGISWGSKVQVESGNFSNVMTIDLGKGYFFSTYSDTGELKGAITRVMEDVISVVVVASIYVNASMVNLELVKMTNNHAIIIFKSTAVSSLPTPRTVICYPERAAFTVSANGLLANFNVASSTVRAESLDENRFAITLNDTTGDEIQAGVFQVVGYGTTNGYLSKGTVQLEDLTGDTHNGTLDILVKTPITFLSFFHLKDGGVTERFMYSHITVNPVAGSITLDNVNRNMSNDSEVVACKAYRLSDDEMVTITVDNSKVLVRRFNFDGFEHDGGAASETLEAATSTSSMTACQISDGKFLMTRINASNQGMSKVCNIDFDGFAQEAGVLDDYKKMYRRGTLLITSGLTAGSKYYLDTSTLNLTSTRSAIFVGTAITSTALVLKGSYESLAKTFGNILSPKIMSGNEVASIVSHVAFNTFNGLAIEKANSGKSFESCYQNNVIGQVDKGVAVHTKNIVTITSNYEVQGEDVILCNNLSPIVIRLPRAKDFYGKELTVKKISATGSPSAQIYVVATVSDLIEGASKITISTVNDVKKIVSDGTNFFVISS